jgi:predicted dienelactone hydrolase
MRLFEILILLTPVPLFLWPVISRQKRPQWVALLPVVGLLFLLLHLIFEGYRWQMIPAYGLTAVLYLYTFWQWRKKHSGDHQPQTRNRLVAVLLALVSLIIVGITAVLPIALPVPRLAEPDGPYEIGTVTYYWVDSSREEMFGPEPGGPRELMVQIWYPAQPAAGEEAVPWHADIKIAGPALANTLDLPPFLLDHIALSRTHSVANASLADGQEQYQLLIFSHGLGGVRMQNTYLMEELASQGYVVASIDHTYGGAVTIFPDGRVALFDLSTMEGDVAEAGNSLIHIWTEDGRFVLDQLEQLNEADPDGRFTGRLRLEQIGYFGHSTGGGTAFLFCQVDERCGAGVALDGWLEPLAQEIAAQPMHKPFLFLKAEDWSTPENSAAIQAADTARQTPGSVITLLGTRHYNFSDLPLLSPLTPQMGLTGPANGRETLALINDYTLSFFNDNLGN